MKNFACIAFLILLVSSSRGLAQSPSALGARKVQDYFQDVESKSYYQQERIRSMKGEMNEYSERLHGLQEKFHKIFYGKSTDELHQSPFGDKDKISYPQRKYRDPVPLAEVESIVRRPSKYSASQKETNQLAFTVDEARPAYQPRPVQAEQSDVDSTETTEEPTGYDLRDEPFAEQQDSSWEEEKSQPSTASDFGGYLILRPGVVFPYKTQTTHQGASKTKHRDYKPGMAISLSGGYRLKGWKLGAGVLYRKNEHDSKSYERVGAQMKPFAKGSESMSIAGFLEVGYTHAFTPWFGLYSSLGLGYGVSVVEDYAPLLSNGQDRTRLDPFFYASGGLGAVFTPTDHLALSLGYRYHHEREVPAHALELGLEGKF